MANVKISELPPVTLPIVTATTFFEVETLESGISVSRKIAAIDLPSGGVQSVSSGTNVTVDNTDPANPIINLNNPVVANVTGNVNSVTLTAAGGGTLFLANDGIYKDTGGVDTVSSGTNITVNNADPANPIINLNNPVVANLTGNVTGNLSGLVNAVALTDAGGGANFLADDGTYKPAGGTFPSGSVNDMLYLDTAPDIYSATSNLTFEPATPVHTFRGGAPLFRVQQFQNNTSGGLIHLDKSRAVVTGDHTIVVSGDSLGSVIFEGSDGTNFIPAARILGAVDGTPGVNDMPGRLVFSTTADGASGVSEAFRITATGALVSSGRTAAFATPVTFSTVIPQILAQSTTAAGIASVRHSNDTASAFIFFGKSRSGTFGGQTVVISGDSLGTLDFRGSDGTAMIQAAAIVGASDGTPGANDMPGRLSFFTTPDGAATALERVRVRSTGQSVFYPTGGTFNNPPAVGGVTPAVTVQGSAASTFLTADQYFNDATGPGLAFRKSRSNTVGSMSIVQANDPLGSILFYGSDGNDFFRAAQIIAEVDGTPGSNDMPGRLTFSLSPDGSTTPVSLMRLRQSTLRQPLALSPDSGTNYHAVPMVQVMVKTANTDRNTTTTLADDTGAGALVGLILMPSSTYILTSEMSWSGNGGTVGDFQWNYDFNGQIGNVTFFSGSSFSGGDAAGTATSLYVDSAQTGVGNIASAGVRVLQKIMAVIVTNSSYTAGTAIDFQWAQQTSDATNTTLEAGSWYKLEKVA
jgi:hypothetical protein